MKVTTAEHQFSDNEELDEPSYRPISRFVIAAVVLTLLSWLALIHPLMLIVPILGAIASLAAHWQSTSAEKRATGASLAVWTMAICIGMGSCAVSAAAYDRWQLSEQASAHSIHWLNLVREGKLHEAHQLTLSESHRIAPDVALEPHYAPRERQSLKKAPPGEQPNTEAASAENMMEMMMPSPSELFGQFFGEGYPKKLSELGSSATYHFQRTLQVQAFSPSETRVKQLIRVDYLEGGQSRRFEFVIVLVRMMVGNVAMWHVEKLEPAGI